LNVIINLYYLILSQDSEKVAASFYHRWKNIDYRASIIRAFANGVIMKAEDWKEDEMLDVCRLFI
jgi:hypothetical protein